MNMQQTGQRSYKEWSQSKEQHGQGAVELWLQFDMYSWKE